MGKPITGPVGPRSPEEAKEMRAFLAGNTSCVHTGCTECTTHVRRVREGRLSETWVPTSPRYAGSRGVPRPADESRASAAKSGSAPSSLPAEILAGLPPDHMARWRKR